MFTRLLIRKRRAFRHSPVAIATVRAQLTLPGLVAIETVSVYDLFDCPERRLDAAISRVFADPVSDRVIETLPQASRQLVIEPLPGQFDQRADSAEQCLRLLDPGFARTTVRTAVAWLIHGELDDGGYGRLKAFLINPIETREKDLSVKTLPTPAIPEDVPHYPQLPAFDAQALAKWHEEKKLAMRLADLQLIQKHFKALERAPSETEIQVLDTYWSDHCRHTTFSTHLGTLHFPASPLGHAIAADYRDFLGKRRSIYGTAADARPVTLMELATIDARYLRKTGKLEDVELSAEVNACSIFVTVTENQEQREWLLQFKNETHNHPTEIEPFGGAATCIGGAIRDPLSGRAYVYQALRLSGSADPREAIAATLPGKLPQRVIAERSAAGASSYGNQIGLATGQVVEVYHPGYKAKHLEVGAVLAATPADHVRREQPQPGDIVLLLGGATGRDGCGGATGSSRAHDNNSLDASAAEVQKGNPPEERKLQRLFRKKAFARTIKRCNDFGAGGIAVAIGELADGIAVDLDAVPVKYQGLNGTELAISESQERMAVVVAPADESKVQRLAGEENLAATRIAVVTDDATLTMRWRGEIIVSLARALLDSNGAPSRQDEVRVPATPLAPTASSGDWRNALETQLQHLSMADQRGLGDRFDFSVGAGCVLLPYGGRCHETPSEAGVYLLPTDTPSDTASVLSYGFNPTLSAQSPYHGGMLAVAEASVRLIACGGDLRRAHFSLQEYFPRPGDDPKRWGLPVAALLGAHHALAAIGRAAIGGKDSMSGSFKERDVPPTLIAFAVTTVEKTRALSPEFKAGGDHLYWLRCPRDALERPDFITLRANNDRIVHWNHAGLLSSARSVRHGGVLQAIYEAARGNRIGVRIAHLADASVAEYGSFLLTSEQPLPHSEGLLELGTTSPDPILDIAGTSVALAELLPLSNALGELYPFDGETSGTVRRIPPLGTPPAANRMTKSPGKPRVCLPVFPGTNSELDTARAFTRAGGVVRECLIRNRRQADIRESLDALTGILDDSQIFVLCGGFSAGDEPDGAGKFIANILAHSQVAEAIERFLTRDGLILGICNGFQALLKSGLLSYGEVRTQKAGDPTLTHNPIRRHIARILTTTVANNRSPWLRDFAIGERHDLAFSHGEGRFHVVENALAALIAGGQVATQYADPETGAPSMRAVHNPNGSVCAIEGISSPCGRIFGKMGHSERYQNGIYRNHPNFRAQDIFRAGVRAFA